MVNPELNDLYLQFLQVKAQNSKLIYELLAQKQGWWQKNYGSVVAIVSIIASYIVAYKVSKWTLKNQLKIEEEKRNEEKAKINKDTFKRLYSELNASLFEFINKSVLSDFEKIHFHYYKEQSNLYKSLEDSYKIDLDIYIQANQTNINTNQYEKDVEYFTKLINEYESKVKECKEKTESSHQGMMEYTRIMVDCFNKINTLAYEYDYLQNESEVIKLVGGFTDYLNGFITKGIFANEINLSIANKKVEIYKFQETRDYIIDKNVENYEKILKPIIYKIQKKIKEETKLNISA